MAKALSFRSFLAVAACAIVLCMMVHEGTFGASARFATKTGSDLVLDLCRLADLWQLLKLLSLKILATLKVVCHAVLSFFNILEWSNIIAYNNEKTAWSATHFEIFLLTTVDIKLILSCQHFGKPLAPLFSLLGKAIIVGNLNTLVLRANTRTPNSNLNHVALTNANSNYQKKMVAASIKHEDKHL
ncbi:hypothetical protein MTO96_026924 [Rhipicephalus appendiculatus]